MVTFFTKAVETVVPLAPPSEFTEDRNRIVFLNSRFLQRPESEVVGTSLFYRHIKRQNQSGVENPES